MLEHVVLRLDRVQFTKRFIRLLEFIPRPFDASDCVNRQEQVPEFHVSDCRVMICPIVCGQVAGDEVELFHSRIQHLLANLVSGRHVLQLTLNIKHNAFQRMEREIGLATRCCRTSVGAVRCRFRVAT